MKMRRVPYKQGPKAPIFLFHFGGGGVNLAVYFSMRFIFLI